MVEDNQHPMESHHHPKINFHLNILKLNNIQNYYLKLYDLLVMLHLYYYYTRQNILIYLNNLVF